MNIPETYDYLRRARRDLWATLETVPDEVLSKPLLNGEQLHSIKDLIVHTAVVEDGWLHFNILSRAPVIARMAGLNETRGGPVYAGFSLDTLLNYWQAVEQETLAYLGALTQEELDRVVEDQPDDGGPPKTYTVDGLLWHVMIHEMRHTAQIAVLLRTQGLRPPSLDLLFYLPDQPAPARGG